MNCFTRRFLCEVMFKAYQKFGFFLTSLLPYQGEMKLIQEQLI